MSVSSGSFSVSSTLRIKKELVGSVPSAVALNNGQGWGSVEMYRPGINGQGPRPDWCARSLLDPLQVLVLLAALQHHHRQLQTAPDRRFQASSSGRLSMRHTAPRSLTSWEAPPALKNEIQGDKASMHLMARSST